MELCAFAFVDGFAGCGVEGDDESASAHGKGGETGEVPGIELAFDAEGFFVTGFELCGDVGRDFNVCPTGFFSFFFEVMNGSCVVNHGVNIFQRMALL